MVNLDNATFVHTLIATSDDAIAYCYWHSAKLISAKWRPGVEHSQSLISKALSLFSSRESRDTFELSLRVLYGAREKALLLIFKGIGRPLSEQKLQELVGVNTNEAPFTKVLLSQTRQQIENLWGSLVNHPFNMDGYMTFKNDEETILRQANDNIFPVPAQLHPSSWTQNAEAESKSAPPSFASPKTPQRNPAVAFSQFANDLHCAYCNKLNVAPQWPTHGDMVYFYAQTQEKTKERPGAHRIKVLCPFCNKEWFIVWDQSPL